MDVAGQLYHIRIVFHQDAFESPLKQMTGPEMPVIEPCGVRNSEPLRSPGQIGSPGPEQNMVVVAIRTNAYTSTSNRSLVSPRVYRNTFRSSWS